MTSAAANVAVQSTRYLGTFPTLKSDIWAVIGQDGGQSVAIGDKTLFVFSDTLLMTAANGLEKSGPPFSSQFDGQSIFLANTAGTSKERDISAALAGMKYYLDDRGLPKQVLNPSPGEHAQKIRFWPEHGVFIDGKVYLYYLGVKTIDPNSIWGFRNLGVGLAVLDPETGACDRVSAGDEWLLWKSVGDDFHFGVQVVRDGDYAYVFGSVRAAFYTGARLARVRCSDICSPEAYEYLSSPRPDWTSSPEKAYDLGETSNEFSVSYNPYLKKFTMTYLDGYKKVLMLRTADELWGPYGEPVRIVAVIHDKPGDMVYLGFEHPIFRKNDGKTIYVSYCQSHFSANSLLSVTFR